MLPRIPLVTFVVLLAAQSASAQPTAETPEPVVAAPAPIVIAPARQGPPGWPVPQIMARGRPAAAPQGSIVPRTVSLTYIGEIPGWPDVAPPIAVPPATAERARLTSLAVDPIGFVSGHYGMSLARQVGEHVALRADGQFVQDLEDVSDSSTWRMGFTVPLYLDRTFQGPFIEPGVAVSSRLIGIGRSPLPTDGLPAFYGVREYAAGPQIYVGYQRMFRNGLHIAGAIGASQDWTGRTYPPGLVGITYGAPPLDGTGIGAFTARPNAETYLRVGYAF